MCCDLPDVRGRHVVLGVTGGIAVYKSCEIVSRLRKLGVETHVIMTKNAAQFVQPLTFETLSNHPVVTDTFARPETWEVEHIALAKRADVFAIAPATANIMAKMACGIADDMLSTTVLATKAPILLGTCHEYWHVDGSGDAAERADLESPRRAFCRAGSGLFGVRRYGCGPHE